VFVLYCTIVSNLTSSSSDLPSLLQYGSLLEFPEVDAGGTPFPETGQGLDRSLGLEVPRAPGHAAVLGLYTTRFENVFVSLALTMRRQSAS
jgi:hypothetical protein